MHADIAGADRAEHRVGQRMQPDIGVGMADQAPTSCGIATPQTQTWSPGPKGWTSKPWPTRISPSRAASSRSAAARSCGGGDLQIVLAAGDQQRRDARPPRRPRRRRSGRAPAAARCAARIGAEVEALRRLRPPQVGAVDRRPDRPSSTRLIVSRERQRRDRRRRRSSAVEDAVDQAAIGKRPRAVMDQHALGLVRGQGFEPEPHRILPLGAARRPAAAARGRRRRGRKRLRPRADHDLHAGDRPDGRRSAATAWRSTAPPPSGRYCFGSVAAEPGAAAGGDDEGDSGAMRGSYPAAPPTRQASRARSLDVASQQKVGKIMPNL